VNDHDIHWIALLPLAALLGLASLLAEVLAWWPGRAVRPDLIWCLAFFAMRRTPPATAMLAAFCCGLARDALLGPKLGAAALAYLLVVFAYLHLRETIAGEGFAEHAVLAGGLAFLVNLLKVFFDLGLGLPASWPDYFIVALGDGAATLAAYPPMYLALSLPFLEPTRERRWSL
jgi:rod shape-determining protein MreD